MKPLAATHQEAQAAEAAVASAFEELVQHHDLMAVVAAMYQQVAQRVGPIRKGDKCWTCGRPRPRGRR